jgi:hypothetical protein
VHIEKYGKTRYWAVIDAAGTLVCLCVYRRGAAEVVRRLQALALAQQGQETSHVKEGRPSNIVISERC